MLQLAHELLDADRCGERLLVLHACQRSLALLIREVHPHQAAHDERPAHQDDERYGVFEEQSTSTHQAILRQAGPVISLERATNGITLVIERTRLAGSPSS